jgi:hypothetical protein
MTILLGAVLQALRPATSQRHISQVRECELMNRYANEVNGRHRRSRVRQKGSVAAAVSIAVLVAACGGSHTASPISDQQQRLQQAIAYSQCMRSNGIASFPDPIQSGSNVGFRIDTAVVDVDSPKYQSASTACEKRTGWGRVSPAALQQLLVGAVSYAECMRSHGIAKYPDPIEHSTYVQNGPVPGDGIDENSPQYLAARKACQQQLSRPSGMAP